MSAASCASTVSGTSSDAHQHAPVAAPHESSASQRAQRLMSPAYAHTPAMLDAFSTARSRITCCRTPRCCSARAPRRPGACAASAKAASRRRRTGCARSCGTCRTGRSPSVPERASEQHHELPARVLRALPRPAAASTVRALARRARRPRGSRGGDAGADVRARRRSRTGWTSSTSAAAGARSPCGSPSATRTRASPASPLDARSASTSKPSAPGAASTNVEIVTADANDYDPGRDVDRVLSIEMFEHMRNWKELLRRISDAR